LSDLPLFGDTRRSGYDARIAITVSLATDHNVMLVRQKIEAIERRAVYPHHHCAAFRPTAQLVSADARLRQLAVTVLNARLRQPVKCGTCPVIRSLVALAAA